jgi:hypothetical protein
MRVDTISSRRPDDAPASRRLDLVVLASRLGCDVRLIHDDADLLERVSG